MSKLNGRSDKKQGEYSRIPIPIIILGYILSPPAGIVLTLLRIFTGEKQKTEDKTAGSEKTETRETAAEPKTNRSGICVPAMVLGIIAGVFLLCGVLNVADGLFGGTFQEFLQGSYIPETAMLLVLSASCFIPGCILKSRHDRHNVIRSIIGKRETMQLSQLAAASDLKPKKLRKELQAMIDRGEFGDEAYIDLSSGR